MKTSNESTRVQAVPGAPTRSELQNHILTLYVHQARVIGWMADPKKAWAVLGKAAPNDFDLHCPDYAAPSLASYADIQATPFATLIERLYDFGYFGILDESSEEMADESHFMWIAAILDDLRGSSVLNIWTGGYGGDGAESRQVCLEAAELANARCVLEGGENFYSFRSRPDDEEAVDSGVLTVRQMALLAGMEEMSIRAAANPKRANPLEPLPEKGRTRFAAETAKQWLKARGSYIPVTRRWGGPELDLSKRRFSDLSELAEALVARHDALVLNTVHGPKLKKRLAAIGIAVRSYPMRPDSEVADIDRKHLLDSDVRSKLAEALQLDGTLLALRAREAIANEELSAVQRELRALQG